MSEAESGGEGRALPPVPYPYRRKVRSLYCAPRCEILGGATWQMPLRKKSLCKSHAMARCIMSFSRSHLTSQSHSTPHPRPTLTALSRSVSLSLHLTTSLTVKLPRRLLLSCGRCQPGLMHSRRSAPAPTAPRRACTSRSPRGPQWIRNLGTTSRSGRDGWAERLPGWLEGKP